MKFAPLVIFTYKRADLLHKTIEAILKNDYMSDTDVYIYSDGPKNMQDDKSVYEVRSYLQKLKVFKKLNIIERSENYGLARNIISGVSEVINLHGVAIVLEDDLITSDNFLCYMNAALEYYKNRNNIFAISGYTAPLPVLQTMQEDVYLSYRATSWGWATWSDRWNSVDWDVSDYDHFISNPMSRKKFNKGGADLSRMLKAYKMGKNNSWAVRWTYAMYKQNKYCIYPKASKIQNLGFGSDATHCKSGQNKYLTTLDVSKQCVFKFTDDVEPNQDIAKDFHRRFGYRYKFIKTIREILNV
jgi:glycosyltransferase involved in cell wall biosynthesis